MKKNKIIISLLLMVMFFSVMTPGISFAQEQKVMPNTTIEIDKTGPRDLSFTINLNLDEFREGQYFTLDLPFDINLDGSEFIKIEYLEGESKKIKVTALETKKDFTGVITGSKGYSLTENPTEDIFKVNGTVIKPDDIPTLDDVVGGTGEHPDIYKLGSQNGNIIKWEIGLTKDAFNQNRQTVQITDEFSSNLEYVEGSLEVRYHNRATNEQHLIAPENQPEVKYNKDNGEISFILDNEDNKNNYDYYIIYKTKIIDWADDQAVNQVIVEGKEKVSSEVIITGRDEWGGKDDMALPQVGEKFFSVRGLLILCLLLLGVYGLRGRE